MKFNNRFWFRLHGWFSLPVWSIFCFICLTGTISVLSHELTWLTNPAARADNPQQARAMPVADIIAAVQNKYPTADITSVVFRAPYMATNVLFTDSDKPFATAYVNQYTGVIQEVNDGNTFISFMRALHGWLLFPWQQGYSLGYYLVSIMALVTLGALATGLVVYKKFWRAFFTFKVRWRADKRTLNADLHRLGGVWSIWFLLVMGLTGLWYLVQGVMWHTEYEIEPYPKSLSVSQVPTNRTERANLMPVQDAVNLAVQQFADLQISYIGLPEHHRDTYKIFGYQGETFYDSHSYLVSVDPWSGNHIVEYTPDDMAAIQTIAHIADPLHFGTLGGIWTKLIWFVFGCILTGMSVTGFVMWNLRAFKGKQEHKRATVSLQLQE